MIRAALSNSGGCSKVAAGNTDMTSKKSSEMVQLFFEPLLEPGVTEECPSGPLLEMVAGPCWTAALRKTKPPTSKKSKNV